MTCMLFCVSSNVRFARMYGCVFRWLFSKGRVDEAKRISEKIARRNGKKLSENIWERAEKAGENLVRLMLNAETKIQLTSPSL